MDKGGLNKGDRISGKGSDWRHISVPQLLLDWIRGVKVMNQVFLVKAAGRMNKALSELGKPR